MQAHVNSIDALAAHGHRQADLASTLRVLESLVRETPVQRLRDDDFELFVKLEASNAFGSVKDRPAFWMLKRAIDRGDVGPGTTVVESSSGNLAVALASCCEVLGLDFIPVIDANVTRLAEATLRSRCSTVVTAREPDPEGGFLRARLHLVDQIVKIRPSCFWPNQYKNPDAVQSHYRFTGSEIAARFSRLDYVFLAVSTGGTLAGVSRRLKEAFPSIRVIAVDVMGSAVFGAPPASRRVPGIGAAFRSPFIDDALIDDVIIVSEEDSIRACWRLLRDHNLFVGGSTGSVFAAIDAYRNRARAGRKPRALFLAADRGAAYLDTVYNSDWITRHYGIHDF